MKTTTALTLLLIALTSFPVLAEDAATAAASPTSTPQKSLREVPFVEGDIKVDGHLDDVLWQSALPIDLAYETQPGENIPASVKTTGYIVDNGRELLIGFRAEDPDPSKIRAFLRDRDTLWDDDFIGVVIDTFDDQRRAFELFVNPLGAQGDLILEGSTGNEDSSWDGLWDSAGQITDFGYTVEMRIPYSTLRFQKVAGRQTWSADFLRFRPREHRYRISSMVLPRKSNCYLCELEKLSGFAEADPGRDLEVTPTLTGRYSEHRSGPGEAWNGDSADFEPGVDVKWGIGPNLTVNGTINPDFSQVESDDAQLDLNTTFALFFPEKRPFFLEGADYFNTPLNVLYTRNVGDPDYGARATGREGHHTYGVFAARDASTTVLVPGVLSSNFVSIGEESTAAAGRYRYDFDGQASLGAVATVRSGGDYENILTGVDGRWQQGGHTLTGQLLSSSTEMPNELGAPLQQDGDAMLASYSFANRNWAFDASHTRFDEGFRADLGFISQVGFNRSLIGGARTWHGEKGKPITRVRLNGDWDITHDENGRLLEREVEGYLSVNGPMQSFAQFGALSRARFWGDRLFDEQWGSLYLESQPRSGVRVETYVRKGKQIDFANIALGNVTEVQPAFELNIGRGVNIRLNHVYQTLSRDGGDVFTANLSDLRLGWQINLRQRIRLSLLWQDIERDPDLYTVAVDRRSRDLGGQFLYSYKINPRTALYAGYSESRFADDQINSLFATDRTVFMKFTYAWQPQ